MNASDISVVSANISWQAAHLIVGQAVRHAREIGAAVNVAVVDAGGTAAAFLRMPGAPLHSVEIAFDKAYTAASFGLPTSSWTDVLLEHSVAVREGLVRRPRFVAFGGGLPIEAGGHRIGAIGVSGATEEQDEAIARHGLSALDTMDQPTQIHS